MLKRTPLKANPDKVRDWQNRSRRRLRHETPRKVKINRDYREAAADFKSRNPRCWVYPDLATDDWHHIEGRSENKLMDESKAMAVSRKAHIKIHANPKWARSKGYLPPKCGEEIVKSYSDTNDERHLEQIRQNPIN